MHHTRREHLVLNCTRLVATDVFHIVYTCMYMLLSVHHWLEDGLPISSVSAHFYLSTMMADPGVGPGVGVDDRQA